MHRAALIRWRRAIALAIADRLRKTTTPPVKLHCSTFSSSNQQTPMSAQTCGAFTEKLQFNLANRSSDSEFDLAGETKAVLNGVDAAASETGGDLSFYGRAPIIPRVIRFGPASAIALAAKAVLIASIWKLRTGRSQDIQVDVRKALRRFSPFIDKRWEQVNGYDGGMFSDPSNRFFGDMYEIKDGMWVLPTNPYPGIHLSAATLLDCPSTPAHVTQAVKRWNGVALEEASAEAGIVMPLGRPLKQILEMPVFRESLRDLPLICGEKIADREPKPFSPDARDPLSGIRALGLAHFIAGASIGRALALHGADVLNVWAPEDWEHNVFLYTSQVGVRSTMLYITNADARAKFMQLMAGADVFYSNRRAGFLDSRRLGAKELCKGFPGLIHASSC